MQKPERVHVREITSNREFNLSEHYSLNRQLMKCSGGPSGFRICLANDGDCSICHKANHPDYLKLQGVEILPPKKTTHIVGLDKIEPIFVPVIPMYEREG